MHSPGEVGWKVSIRSEKIAPNQILINDVNFLSSHPHAHNSQLTPMAGNLGMAAL